MSPLRALLLLTLVESFGTVLLERGLYFYTHDSLAFDRVENLALAFAFGVSYVLGALGSHSLAKRSGEKRLLQLSVLALFLVHAALTLQPSALAIVLAFPVIGALQGIKWPLVESFMSAGRPPAELVRVLARYNVTWALSVPLALAAAGPLIAGAWPGLLFAVAAALNLVALIFSSPLALRPEHLHEAHPERPRDAELARMKALLGSARWSMLLSYALLFLLAPLMPEIFARLGLEVQTATSAAGLLDVGRLLGFLALGASLGWRGRALPLWLCIVALPGAFGLILFGDHLLWVALGEVVFGLAAGFVYTAALYYALVVKNASVDAGGAHEGLIGAGFALGPLAGIVAHLTEGALGGPARAMLASVTPLALLCVLLAARPLLQGRVTRRLG